MSLATIADIIRETRERVVAQGVDPVVVDGALMRAESEMVAAELDRMKLFRDLVRRCGTRVVAEREGITPRAVRKRLRRALNEIGTAIAS